MPVKYYLGNTYLETIPCYKLFFLQNLKKLEARKQSSFEIFGRLRCKTQELGLKFILRFSTKVLAYNKTSISKLRN
jgi:hypothetical protein